ncbi:Uncharacterised protein [Burkholderia pseudomallei]|nr:Uncharacterised protein [Burkholderia pseudomallei]VCK72541.1 Uncharacterised protein [Burkholderia pseudomallei]VCK79873.1 Uncharacterised protein [Burkholderia pseudomallei]VCK80129.1 Uncharacterised protein [Burkholderia pseudomallei]VCK80674.1 Uncharacterised protein [Burkholderia pseudomallei]
MLSDAVKGWVSMGRGAANGAIGAAPREALASMANGDLANGRRLALLVASASAPCGIAWGVSGAWASCHPSAGIVIALAALFVAALFALVAGVFRVSEAIAFLARKAQRARLGVHRFGWAAALSATALAGVIGFLLVTALLGALPLPVGAVWCLAIARRRRRGASAMQAASPA